MAAFRSFWNRAQRLREECKGAVVAVPLSGPFSIAQNLLGMEKLLFAVMADPEGVREALLVDCAPRGEHYRKNLRNGF